MHHPSTNIILGHSDSPCSPSGRGLRKARDGIPIQHRRIASCRGIICKLDLVCRGIVCPVTTNPRISDEKSFLHQGWNSLLTQSQGQNNACHAHAWGESPSHQSDRNYSAKQCRELLQVTQGRHLSMDPSLRSRRLPCNWESDQSSTPVRGTGGCCWIVVALSAK